MSSSLSPREILRDVDKEGPQSTRKPPAASNVVQLPRDWLGPREELVPFGGGAAHGRPGSGDEVEAPRASSEAGVNAGSSGPDLGADSVDAPAAAGSKNELRSVSEEAIRPAGKERALRPVSDEPVVPSGEERALRFVPEEAVMPPSAADFWGERAAAIQDVLQGPVPIPARDAGTGGDEPAVKPVAPVAERRPPSAAHVARSRRRPAGSAGSWRRWPQRPERSRRLSVPRASIRLPRASNRIGRADRRLVAPRRASTIRLVSLGAAMVALVAVGVNSLDTTASERSERPAVAAGEPRATANPRHPQLGAGPPTLTAIGAGQTHRPRPAHKNRSVRRHGHGRRARSAGATSGGGTRLVNYSTSRSGTRSTSAPTSSSAGSTPSVGSGPSGSGSAISSETPASTAPSSSGSTGGPAVGGSSGGASGGGSPPGPVGAGAPFGPGHLG